MRVKSKKRSHNNQPAAEKSYCTAVACYQQQNLPDAMRHCKKVLKRMPEHGGANHLLGLMLYGSGKHDLALGHLAKAVRCVPQSEVFLTSLADVQASLGLTQAALESYNQAHEIAPDSVKVLNQFGEFLRQRGKAKDAMILFSRAMRIEPKNVETLRCAGNAFHEMGMSQQALSCFQMALVTDPDNALIIASMGSVFMALGKSDAAAELFEAAVQKKSDLIFAHLGLVSVRKGETTEQQLTTLKQLTNNEMSINEQVDLRFAIAHTCAGLERYDEAFSEYVTANELRMNITGGSYDIIGFERETAARVEVCDRDYFAQRATYGISTKKPVFIVGMPRSGTTLIESIIDSHPLCHGAGELDLLAMIRAEFEGDETNRFEIDEMSRIWRSTTVEVMNDAANSYLEHINTLAPDAARVVDKLPHNFLNLWLVAMMFPEAQIIHCRRNPLDTCVSLFCKEFRMKHGYKNDLRTLGLYYRQYVKLMDHWKRVLPLPILDVQYEDLVADQEGVSRRIIDFCKLEWDPGCLDFHKQQKAVMTASALQVRNTIYDSSIERWRRYENHLGPLIDALE